MPELPEVQTIVSDLDRKIKGDLIVGFWTDWEKGIRNRTAKQLDKEIKNRKIVGVRRIGKNIFIDLEGNKTIFVHLKMTGHLLVKNFKFKILNLKSISNNKISNDKGYFNDRVNQYVHHRWFLNSEIKNSKLNKNFKFRIKNSDKTLEFSDLRKFGKILLLDTDNLFADKGLASLGIDALDKKFTYKKFEEIINKRPKRKIREVLLDQQQIAGIGNIYASEILFDARVLPTRIISSLSSEEKKKIHQSTKKILLKAVKYRGTSDSDYRDTDGKPGGFQKVLMVYNREKQKCKKCGTIILREKIGQRSAFFCPSCQK